MIRTTTLSILNSKIHDTDTVTEYIATALNITEADIIRWAITATHGDDSSIIVTYAS